MMIRHNKAQNADVHLISFLVMILFAFGVKPGKSNCILKKYMKIACLWDCKFRKVTMIFLYYTLTTGRCEVSVITL